MTPAEKAMQRAIQNAISPPVLKYLTQQFEDDIQAEEPYQRLNTVEKYLGYICPKQSSTTASIDVKHSVDDDILDRYDTLIGDD